MVLGREADVLHAVAQGDIQPGVRVEAHRVEPLQQLRVLAAGYAAPPLDLFVPGGNRAEPPVDEHPETPLEEPVPAVAEPQ